MKVQAIYIKKQSNNLDQTRSHLGRPNTIKHRGGAMPQATQTSNWSSILDAYMQKQHLYIWPYA